MRWVLNVSRHAGKHRNPRRLLTFTPDELELWERAVEHAEWPDSWADWARHVLTIAAADELKLDPLEALQKLGRDPK